MPDPFCMMDRIVSINNAVLAELMNEWKARHAGWARQVRVVATFLVRIDFDMRTRSVISYSARPLTHWDSYDDVIEDLERIAEFKVMMDSEIGFPDDQ